MMEKQEPNTQTGLSSNDFFADALLHEAIRVSGTPYRVPFGNMENKRDQEANESDIQSVYNSL